MAQADGALGDTVGQVRQQLAQSTGTGNQQSPVLELMISDFARYHLAMAVIALIAAAISLTVTVVVWARFARTARSERRTRFVSGSIGLLCTVHAGIDRCRRSKYGHRGRPGTRAGGVLRRRNLTKPRVQARVP
ncbi:hypothetical protein ACETU7_01075 [Rhodococcus sp. 3Y1]